MNDSELYNRLDKLERLNAGLQRGVDEILNRMRGCHEAYQTREDHCIICGAKGRLRGDGHECKPMDVTPT